MLIDMLPSDAPCGGLEAYQRRVIWTNIWWIKWEKSLKTFGGPQYKDTCLEKGGMLPNYALVWPRNLSNRSD